MVISGGGGSELRKCVAHVTVSADSQQRWRQSPERDSQIKKASRNETQGGNVQWNSMERRFQRNVFLFTSCVH